MAISYYIVVKSQAGSKVAILDEWQKLSLSHVVNGLGAFSFAMDGDDSRTALCVVDGQIEIYRQDAAQSIANYLEFEGLIRRVEVGIDKQGLKTFTVKGRGYADLLARRIIAYYAGSAYTDKAAVAETVMKAFVSQNLAAAATTPPRIADGVLTGFSVQADAAGGSVWTGARAYRNLLEVLQNIANDSGMDFDVVGTGAALFQFRTYAGQRGTDRTITGLVPATGRNGAGNAPVTFNVDSGNMANPVYTDDRLNEVNAVYVLGGGAESARTVAVRSDAARIADSPINRRENARDARNETTTAGLNSRGDAELEKLQRQEKFDFEFVPTDGIQYGRDFAWGDMITAKFDSYQANKKIVRATISVGASGKPDETIDLDFADVMVL